MTPKCVSCLCARNRCTARFIVMKCPRGCDVMEGIPCLAGTEFEGPQASKEGLWPMESDGTPHLSCVPVLCPCAFCRQPSFVCRVCPYPCTLHFASSLAQHLSQTHQGILVGLKVSLQKVISRCLMLSFKHQKTRRSRLVAPMPPRAHGSPRRWLHRRRRQHGS